MDVCKDVVKIASLAKERLEENQEIRAFLEQAPVSDEELDHEVARLARQATAEVSCVGCHNCCAHQQAEASDEEVERLSAFLGMSVPEFMREYAVPAPLAKVPIRRRLIRNGLRDGTSAPPPQYGPIHSTDHPILSVCVFLGDDGACKVYEARPECCRAYPGLDSGGVRGRLCFVVENCGVCPIVFSVYEELKRLFGRQREG